MGRNRKDVMDKYADAEYMRLIGSRITAAREARMLTQAELAAKLPFTATKLSMIEMGRLRAKVSDVCDIAEALGRDAAGADAAPRGLSQERAGGTYGSGTGTHPKAARY